MSDKYTLIAAEYAANIAVPAAGAPTLTKMCLWIGVSKSGFYDWKDRPLSATAVRQEYLRGKIGRSSTTTTRPTGTGASTPSWSARASRPRASSSAVSCATWA